jgi:hypothetical protein
MHTSSQMTYPNLAGVITKDDVHSKGTGSYAASYVAWARIANHLHTHAPGWEFHLKPSPDRDTSGKRQMALATLLVTSRVQTIKQRLTFRFL